MGFDALVTNPGRLRILTALASAADDRQSFVEVRRRTGLTDGNLATHARRLHSAGLVAIEKTIDSGKPLTTLQLTRTGREALAEHSNQLLAALNPSAEPVQTFATARDFAAEEDWVD
jgi:DNA-binding MarR family transcriptional regulator